MTEHEKEHEKEHEHKHEEEHEEEHEEHKEEHEKKHEEQEKEHKREQHEEQQKHEHKKNSSNFLPIASGVIIAAAIILMVYFYAMGTPESITGGVRIGDNATVQYVGKLTNGTLFDKGNFTFEVGSGMVIPGFDNAVRKMKPGESKTVTIPPEEAYGNRRLDLMQTINRSMAITRIRDYATADLEKQIGEFEIDDTIEIRGIPWPATVTDKNEEFGETRVRFDPVAGSIYYNPLTMWWPISVTEVDDETFVARQDPKIGSVTVSQGGMSGTVTSFDDDNIVIDYNHPLAGKTLVFDITLLDYASGG